MYLCDLQTSNVRQIAALIQTKCSVRQSRHDLVWKTGTTASQVCLAVNPVSFYMTRSYPISRRAKRRDLLCSLFDLWDKKIQSPFCHFRCRNSTCVAGFGTLTLRYLCERIFYKQRAKEIYSQDCKAKTTVLKHSTHPDHIPLLIGTLRSQRLRGGGGGGGGKSPRTPLKVNTSKCDKEPRSESYWNVEKRAYYCSRKQNRNVVCLLDRTWIISHKVHVIM
jgi:hypothetical protein